MRFARHTNLHLELTSLRRAQKIGADALADTKNDASALFPSPGSELVHGQHSACPVPVDEGTRNAWGISQ